MGKRIKRPPIGSKMYVICENLYYIKGEPGPLLEYCVVEGEVTGFYTGGFTEICLTGPYPKYRTPYRRKLNDIGINVFYTPGEAALLAKKMTEDHDNRWGQILHRAPLRRTWECYLEDNGGKSEVLE